MAWEKQPQTQDWRPHLTKDEATQLAALDREAKEVDGKRRNLTVERNLIVNRAIKRWKRASGRQR